MVLVRALVILGILGAGWSTRAYAQEPSLVDLYKLVAAQGEQIKLLTQELDATKAKLASTDADVKITEERLVSTVEFVEQHR